MSTSSGSDRETVMAVYDEWEAVNEKVAALSLDALTVTELLALQCRSEVVARRQPVVDHQIINRLATEADPKALGGKNLADVLARLLRISDQEAGRRIKAAESLGPRTAITGEPLAPKLPSVAAAQQRGQIGPEHLKVITKFFGELPAHVDHQTREATEADLARIAAGLGPTEFRAAAERLAFLLDQDGAEPTDADRARKRYFTIERQGRDGMSKCHGLPCTIIVSTTLQELQSAAGTAVTAGGTLLPISDVIRLASHSHHYLTIFDKHTGEALYLGHSKRFASAGQRIVLLARDRGCTRPGCTAPGYWCQAHHVDGWAHDGPTDVDKLTLACGPDNRMVEEGGWTTRKRADGRIEWIPPPNLDAGQARVNNYHHPERYLLPGDEDEDGDDDAPIEH